MVTASFALPAHLDDRVTAAWRLLLGEELHYGVFHNGDEPLCVATAALTRRMLDAAQLAPGLDVLDVGCGVGTQACRMALEHGVHVVGISTSPIGVLAATELAQATGAQGLEFDVRDGAATGLPDRSFDRVWALESTHLIRDRAGFVRECARLLRPGGRVVLCDLVRHRDISFDEVRARREEFAVLRSAFGDAHMLPLGWYAGGFAVAGLQVTRSDDLTDLTLPTFDRWRRNAHAHADEVGASLGVRGLATFLRACDILESLWRDGTFGYGLVVASKSG